MTTALVFPGQGSQTVGMGKALAEAFPAAREVFERVDAALGESLSKVIFEGPDAALTLTANAQPALMATSLAALRALESEAGLDVARDAAFVAGHSLGEYSALCAAGALTLEDAARLLRIRGAAMQQAVPVGEGALGAFGFGDLHRPLDRGLRARDHHLSAAVIVGGLADAAVLRRFGGDRRHRVEFEAEDRRHRAFSDRDRLLHRRAADA